MMRGLNFKNGEKMKENKVFKIVIAAVFCALVFTMTFISIPTPSVGNINLGDCMVILSACLIGGWYGVFAGAVGAALCDLAGGYAIYAPGTLIIKALMVIVILIVRRFVFKNNKSLSLVVSGACAEVVMIIGYFVYEALILGYGIGAIMNVPFNTIQGVINLLAAVILYATIKKAGILNLFSEN